MWGLLRETKRGCNDTRLSARAKSLDLHGDLPVVQSREASRKESYDVYVVYRVKYTLPVSLTIFVFLIILQCSE